jgi:hypothetical protein
MKTVKLKSIRKVSHEPMRCIHVTNPNGLYVINHGIVTHNSLLAILINLYESVHFALMWHPYKFFGQSAATIYTQTFCAWSLKKGSELLLEPMEQILEQAPYFVRMRTHDEIVANAHDDEVADHICWTHATKSSALSMQNGVNYKLISDPGGLLGQTIMTGTMTELAFFTENGWTDEKILKFFTKLRQRIDSRMKGNYYGRFVLDSSPNNMESVIDKWIWEEAPKDPKNYIITGSRWKFFPEDFPYFFDENHNERHDFKNGFPLYTGGNGQPCQVLESQAQVDSHEQSDIIWCPVMQKTNNGLINFHDAAAENPIEFMRDWCGMPSGAADRIFYVPSIIDHVFDNNLKNVFSSIAAPKTEEPEHLIWNQVKDVFFHRIIDRYYFYYEPEIPRVASVDLAISGDTACISVSHVERDETKVDDNGDAVKVYVTDFTIPVTPKGGIINLDAFKFFIEDLRLIGNMNITHVSFDGFQSRSMMQALERDGITVDLLSVDKQNGPYLSFIDYVFHKRYYCGKSIMVKNNMLALQMTKRKETGTTKIDHKHGENVYTDQFATIGTTYNDNSWKYSQIGKFAKDTTDCIAGNISLLDTYANEYIPTHVFKAGDIYERSYENEKRKNELLMKNMGLSIQ